MVLKRLDFFLILKSRVKFQNMFLLLFWTCVSDEIGFVLSTPAHKDCTKSAIPGHLLVLVEDVSPE